MIAAVNGLALGGGVEIVLACVLAIAAAHAQFALPEPRVGLAATGGGGLQRLARQMSLKQVMRLARTGRQLGAEEARGMGLINRVLPAGELMAVARGEEAAIVSSRQGLLTLPATLAITQSARDGTPVRIDDILNHALRRGSSRSGALTCRSGLSGPEKRSSACSPGMIQPHPVGAPGRT